MGLACLEESCICDSGTIGGREVVVTSAILSQ